MKFLSKVADNLNTNINNIDFDYEEKNAKNMTKAFKIASIFPINH